MSTLSLHSRRLRAIRRISTPVAIAAALAINALVIGSVTVFGADLGRASKGRTDGRTPRVAEVALEPSCEGDVLLATTARAALCLAPWGANLTACTDDMQTQMWMDLSSCRVGTAPLAEVQMVKERATEKLAQIDPEQLLEELAQQEKLMQQPTPTPAVQPPQPQPQPPRPPPPPRQAQVVETVKPSEEQEPDNARFLSEYNTRTDKQTVSRGARNEPLVAKAKPEELTPTNRPKAAPAVAKAPDPTRDPGKSDRAPDAPGALAMRKPGAVRPDETPQVAKAPGVARGNPGPTGKDGYIPRKGDGSIEQNRRDPGKETPGQGGAGGGVPQLPDLAQNREILERVAGGGSVDHLDDVEAGDENALNSKKWVHASFFNRVKRTVAQHWNPSSVIRRTDPDGKHNGATTRQTVVRVSLNPSGGLVKVVVMTPSGFGPLDDEALRAFQAAAPFPNAPAALAGKNGLITFEFGFVMEMGTPRTSWRMPRQ